MNKIIVLDFGGQYCHLIARRLRDLGVLAEVLPAETSAGELAGPAIKGIILSGGARSVYAKDAPQFDEKILALKKPILGICYGHQLIAHVIGGKVVAGKAGEYGVTRLIIRESVSVLAKLAKVEQVWMNHGDVVTALPLGFKTLASTKHSKIAAFASSQRQIFGVQFHPEVSHTEKGERILSNFAFNVCRCSRSRTTQGLIGNIIDEASAAIGGERAIIGLSGGVDSSVAALLVSRAIGRNLVAVYVDTGLMRQNETKFIKKAFKKARFRLIIVRGASQFFKALKGVTAPEQKRKIIGRLFAEIFTAAAKKEQAKFLIQGTIYSDRIESGLTKHASIIKSHHNVGGLPKNLKLKLYEPLKDLYKDEVRAIARALKLPQAITERQVFPGPGLAVRIIGEVTPERVKIVRAASAIIEEELRQTEFWPSIWMSFAVLLPIKSVGIQGDERSYKYPVVIRIIESRDAMTANFSKIPYAILERISTRITNEVKPVNRVVYDITNKPPATMEWE